MLTGKSATLTATVKRTSDLTDRRSNTSVEDKTVERKRVLTKPVQCKPEDRQRRSATSSGKNNKPVVNGPAHEQVASTKRLTQTSASSTAGRTATTVATTSRTVGCRSASASKNDRTPMLAGTSQVVAASVRKTTSDKLGKPATNTNNKSLGKQQLVKSAYTCKFTSLSSVRDIILVNITMRYDTIMHNVMTNNKVREKTRDAVCYLEISLHTKKQQKLANCHSTSVHIAFIRVFQF